MYVINLPPLFVKRLNIIFSQQKLRERFKTLEVLFQLEVDEGRMENCAEDATDVEKALLDNISLDARDSIQA